MPTLSCYEGPSRLGCQIRGVKIMKLPRVAVALLVLPMLCLAGSLSPALGAGNPAYARVESCEYSRCYANDCGWYPYWYRYYCEWKMIVAYYDCDGEMVYSTGDAFQRAPLNTRDSSCFGCTEGSPCYVWIDNCIPMVWAYLRRNLLFGDWDCHRGAVVDLRTPEMIEAGCDPYIPPLHPERNLGWGDDPVLYCPTKAGGASVNVGTGNHTERVVDLSISGPGIPLEFVRFYNSQSSGDGPLGFGWTHSYNISLEDLGDEVLIWDRDGRALSFGRTEEGTFEGRSGAKDLLEETPSGYILTKKSLKRRYLFDHDGRLTRIEDLNGNSLDLIYEGDELREVRSSFGKSLLIYYTGGRIERIQDPKGKDIVYGYEGDNLSSVLYPDGTETTYLYEDPDDPYNMTAELDTEGKVVGLWDYDSRDRTILSEGGEGADHMDLEYEFFKTLLTDGRGNTKTYHTQIKENIYLAEAVEGEGCAGCSSNREFRYDQGLNLVEEVDGNGNTTLFAWIDEETHKIYGYDRKGNSSIKIGAFGRPEERETFYSYTYDETTPLVIREKVETRKSVLSPEREKTTKWTYDEAGNLLSTEETGYMLIDDVPTLKTYKTEYHYTDLGELTSMDGPRTDVTEMTYALPLPLPNQLMF